MLENPYQTFAEYQTDALKTLSPELHIIMPPELIHGIIGIVTEAVEMQEALNYEGGLIVFDGEEERKFNIAPTHEREFDRVNFAEEIGDALWYVAVAFRYAGICPNNLPFYDGIIPLDENDKADHDIAVELVTELFIKAGNALDICKKAMYYGRKPDERKLATLLIECGGALLMLADWCGYEVGSITAVNIEKLQKRFPEKFEAGAANNRDLTAERATLELITDNTKGEDAVSGGEA